MYILSTMQKILGFQKLALTSNGKPLQMLFNNKKLYCTIHYKSAVLAVYLFYVNK